MNRNDESDARPDGPHPHAAAAAREWALQERAREDERRGAPMSEDEPRLAQYRLLSRALRAPPMEPIPYGFAEQVARRAQAAAEAGDGIERWLQRLLLLGLVVASASLIVGGATDWLAGVDAAVRRLPAGVVSWGALAGACCLLSWGCSAAARAAGLEPAASARAA
ncbi:hypothetical protein SAMN04487939_12312 [Lysobacter sp. yr284]|uniref:hypothetical protein n=1 Tax=Lysobacter sp. yr284 TaxID=1761791 RepID=UPI00089B5E64|nr:hypothetical protein [Lysobacter sp. yr284]SDZ21160.1 hypothetical protein SAMN04487939_12312 [Lysobacter sp. yr284]